MVSQKKKRIIKIPKHCFETRERSACYFYMGDPFNATRSICGLYGIPILNIDISLKKKGKVTKRCKARRVIIEEK